MANKKSVPSVIESVIGGSSICEAVKQLAYILFESSFEDIAENDDDDTFGERNKLSDQDRINDKFGVPMSIVGDEVVRPIDPKQRQRELATYSYEQEMDNRAADDLTSDVSHINEAYLDAKYAIKKLATRYGDQRTSINSCKSAVGQFVINYLNDNVGNDLSEQHLRSQYNLSSAKLQELKSWLEQANNTPDIASRVGSLYRYGIQTVELRTKSMDMAGKFMPRSPEGGYALQVDLPYVIVRDKAYEVPWSSGMQLVRDLTWYNNVLSKLPISQKKGGNVSVTPTLIDVGDVYRCEIELVKTFFKNMDDIIGKKSPMAGDGLDDDTNLEPVDLSHAQRTPESAFDDFRYTHDYADDDYADDDYYSAYKGSVAANALLKNAERLQRDV